MTPFHYSRASDVADAISQIAADPAAKFIAGGTNLIDLMKYDVEHPARLIDISRLPPTRRPTRRGRPIAAPSSRSPQIHPPNSLQAAPT